MQHSLTAKLLRVLADDSLELLFPTRCLGCDQRGTWFCTICTRTSQLDRPLNHCQRCNRLVAQPGQLCRRCRHASGLNGLVSFGSYQAEPLRRAIHWIKYQGVWAAVGPLVSQAESRFAPILNARSWTAIVPIPLHPDRLRERSFNQAEVIARSLAADTPLRTELIRTRATEHQTILNRKQRHDNLKGVFAWEGESLRGPVLLVDDVTTTGATLREAAQVLRAAGARQVWGLTLAHDL